MSELPVPGTFAAIRRALWCLLLRCRVHVHTKWFRLDIQAHSQKQLGCSLSRLLRCPSLSHYFSSAVAPECCDKAASSQPETKQRPRTLNTSLVQNQGPALRNVPWHWLVHSHGHSHGMQLTAALQHWCNWSHMSNPLDQCEVNLYICSGHLHRISEHRTATLELLSSSNKPANCLEFLEKQPKKQQDRRWSINICCQVWWSWHLWLWLSTAVPTVKISDYCFNKQFLSEVPDICCCKRQSAKGTKDGGVIKKPNPWGSLLNKIIWVISPKTVHTKTFLSGLLIGWDFTSCQECPSFLVPLYKNQTCRSPKIDPNLFATAQQCSPKEDIAMRLVHNSLMSAGLWKDSKTSSKRVSMNIRSRKTFM